MLLAILMTESEHQSYWQHDLVLGEGFIRGEPKAIRLRLHASRDDYRGRDELLPRALQVGPRSYLHARAYILEPDIHLSVSLCPNPPSDNVVGEVMGTEWQGMRHRELGNAQAWLYPADRTAVLWEAYLFDHYRLEDPLADQTLITFWTGMEQVIADHVPGVERIITPSWEDVYDRALWQQFLRERGYRSFTNRAFIKELGRP
jgi:hypothetical protein